MLTAVQLDNEFLAGSTKVYDVVADGMFGDSCHLSPDGSLKLPRAVSSKVDICHSMSA